MRHALTQLQVETRDAETNESQLEAQMHQLSAVRGGETGALPKLQELETEAATARSLYDAFTQGLYRATAQDGVPTPKGRIIQTADVVDWPTFPNVPIFMAVIFIAGFMIAFGVVYVMEARDKAFHSAREIESAVHLRVLGMTMLLPTAARRLIGRRASTGTQVSISGRLVAEPSSAISEMVRLVRTAIMFFAVRTAPPRSSW